MPTRSVSPSAILLLAGALLLACGGRSRTDSDASAAASAGRAGSSAGESGSGGAGAAHGASGSAGTVAAGASGSAGTAAAGAAGLDWGAPLDCQALSSAPTSDAYELVFDSRTNAIHYVVAKADLTLVGIRNRSIVSVGPGGAITSLSSDPLTQAFEGEQTTTLLSPRGTALLARDGNRAAVLVFETGGMAMFEPPDDLDLLNLAFSDSGNFVITLNGRLGLETSDEKLVEIRRLNGEVVASQPPRERIPFIPATDDQLIWSEADELIGTDFEGRETFRFVADGNVNNAFASADGRAAMVETGTLVQFMKFGDSFWWQPTDLGFAPMHRGISSSGGYAVYTTTEERRMQKLLLGGFDGPLETGIVRYNSVDVNDDGMIIAAGFAADERQLVELRAWDGRILLSCFAPPEKNIWPSVGFTRDGRHAYALLVDRLRLFDVPER